MIYHYNRNANNVAFCIFSRRTLNNFCKLLVIIDICNENKQIDNISKIMSKRHVFFIENFTISFSNAGKIGNVREFKFDKFQKTIFWRLYECNIYIVQTNTLDFKQLYIIYKKIYLSERIPYLAQTFNYSSQK